jgi:hypothetical protein
MTDEPERRATKRIKTNRRAAEHRDNAAPPQGERRREKRKNK